MENMELERIVRQVLTRLTQEKNDDAIPVEMSGRHVHLSKRDAMKLFEAELTPVRELSQPGQFLCRERVRLIGPKGVMDNVAVLGPFREQSQVEISLTDARALGVNAPIRQSGDLAGSPGMVLSSGKKIIGLEQGVIVAGRHIHMSPEDALHLGVEDRQMVNVSLEGSRPAVFRDVLVRVNPEFRLVMHIDADEFNGTGCSKKTRCRIVSDPEEVPCRLPN